MEKYQAPAEDINFIIKELIDIDSFSKKINNEDITSENINMIIKEAGKFASQELDDINHYGDQKGIKLENGIVRMPEPFIKAYKKSCGNKGMLDPKDMVGVVEFLISDKSRYITGQNIRVDGGLTRSI